MNTRRIVPFDSLWQMRIDVPYSLLVRDGDHAWSCGQLALDSDSNVIAADDLARQSAVVADHVATVLRRGGMAPEHAKRLMLYHVPTHDADHAEQVEMMRSVFRSTFGNDVVLDAIAVPHFYYDGIVLEVDAFAGPIVGDRFNWVSVDAPADDIETAVDNLDPGKILSAHWFAPAGKISSTADVLATRGLLHDAGAAVQTGGRSDRVTGSVICMADDEVTERTTDDGGVRITSRRAGSVGWVAARTTGRPQGLVDQTEQIMEGIAAALGDEGVDFAAVVKSTTLYSGGDSEAELHDNMAVRNRRYRKPGPASTGLPVHGFADPDSLATVDVTYLSG